MLVHENHPGPFPLSSSLQNSHSAGAVTATEPW